EKIPLFMTTFVFCVAAFAAQHRGGAVQNLERYPFVNRLANATVAYVLYLKKALWPVGLAAFYPHPEGTLPPAQLLAAGAVLVAITAVAILWLRRRPFLLVGWLWYLGTLVPVIGLVQVGNQQMADRYTYLPLIGIFFALSWAVPVVLRSP